MERLVIHLGAHKTATTYIQSRFYNSREELSKNGIGYLGLRETRRRITSKIKKDMKIDETVRGFLDDHDTVFLSDENILGGVFKPKGNLVYEKAGDRLSYLLDAFSFDDVKLHLTIRSPESYLVSRYCEYLRHYKFMPIHEYFDEIFLREFSWLPLIEKLEEVSGASIEVTSFEKLFDDEGKYFDSLLNKKLLLEDASDSPSVKRAKVSKEAYDILLEASRHFPSHVIKMFMNTISKNKQVSEKSDLKPFGKSLSSRLAENYEVDKKCLGIN